MTKSGLLRLIANGEDSGVVFKKDDLRPEQIAREAVALANLQGGRIVLGVDHDGAITGIRRSDLESWVFDTVFGRKVHPMILPFYEEIQVNDRRRVAVISLSQGTARPYVVRHNGRDEVYVRAGNVARRATRETQARLFAVGGMLHAELLPVSGSALIDLSRERLTDYLTRIVGDHEIPTSETEWGERLCGLGFMTERHDGPPLCTIAGLLLFAYNPRRLMRQAGIRWMAFKDDDKAYDALDDQVLDGPLVAYWKESPRWGRKIVEKGLIENLADSIRPFVLEESGDINESMRRERNWHYPMEALREAVVNALAHRDWTRYEEIELVRYVDRLVILSPGALPNTMTIEKMLAGQRSARNPLVVEVLRDYGYVDARGMGVRKKIIPLLRNLNGVDPEFEATEDYLKLTLRKGPATDG